MPICAASQRIYAYAKTVMMTTAMTTIAGSRRSALVMTVVVIANP